MPLPSQSSRSAPGGPVSKGPASRPASGGPAGKGGGKPKRPNWTPIALAAGGVLTVGLIIWLASGSSTTTAPATPGKTGVLATDAATNATPPTTTPSGTSGLGTLGGTPIGGVRTSTGASTPAGGGAAIPAETAPPPASTLATPAGTPASNTTGTPTTSTAGGPAPSAPLPAPSVTPPQPSMAEVLLPADLQDAVNAGRARLASGDAVGARVLLSRALLDDRMPEVERAVLRDDLTRINEDLVFSKRIDKNDPFVATYEVRPGDSLVRIDRQEKLGPDWRLIQRINGMSGPNRLNVGQKLKLVRGPFHAVVHKGAYRLDLFMGDPAQPAQWVYVRSFAVGLGEANSTPTGEFRVRPGSKLVNPHWVNPRTGEKFDANDPKNPIGEHWLGLEGLGQAATITGYGIHGTIEPDSIGRQRSMGCVRLGAADVELVYELLGEGVSLVRVAP